jgi:hypothetical protein
LLSEATERFAIRIHAYGQPFSSAGGNAPSQPEPRRPVAQR